MLFSRLLITISLMNGRDACFIRVAIIRRKENAASSYRRRYRNAIKRIGVFVKMKTRSNSEKWISSYFFDYREPRVKLGSVLRVHDQLRIIGFRISAWMFRVLDQSN